MNAIYKYKLEIVESQKIELPLNGRILCIQIQDGIPCMWVNIDLREKTMQDVTIVTIGTGDPHNSMCLEYIDTYQLDKLVFHCFKDHYQ